MSAATTAPNMTQVRGQYPPASKAWLLVMLLSAVYILSYVDRYVLNLLVEPIKRDLALSDVEMGWLLGPAFGLVYAVSGLFFGWLADSKRRTWIIAAGITIWSSAMLLSGKATSFWQLFGARMTVGAGESALSPCAMSMISDSFPPERRGRPVAFYSAALSLGGGVASIVGGLVLNWAKGSSHIILPLFGSVQAWQMTLIIVGLPGFLAAVIFLFVREPARVAADRAVQKKATNLIDALSYLAANWRPFLMVASLSIVMIILAFTHSWHASLFQRVWGWDAPKYAFVNGTTLLICGPAVAFAAGWMSDKWSMAGKTNAPVAIAVTGVALIVVTEITKSLSPSGEIAILSLGINTMGFAMTTAVGVTALLNITPSAVRAQIIAIYYLINSVAGAFIGPPAIGWMNDHIFTQPDGIRYSMMVLPIVLGIPVLLLAPMTLRQYANERKRLAASVA
jgi:MFS family permease